MPSLIHPSRWTARQAIFLPVAALSALFLITILIMAGLGAYDSARVYGIAAAAIGVNALALFILCRIGWLSAESLESNGKIDTLTSLPNRRALHADIQAHVDAGTDVAIGIIDLDGFKQVNDHFGHAIGDELIRAVARLIAETCGKDARSYRLNGDEFVLCATGPIAGNVIEGICRMIVDRLRKPVQLEVHAIAVGASVGLARGDAADGVPSSELLRRADVAMFASKRGGKMRCTWYAQTLDRNREARLDLDDELRQALARNELQVHYQPLVDAKSGAIVAVESLLRWPKPDGHFISPALFIPVAEESGLINAIGTWVLRTACRDALGWDDLRLSVNISAAQLRNPDFPVQVGHILEETGFPAERLELEVTETCLVLDPVVVGRSLDVLREFGISISLDDFGTGYASIGFLRQFRFEKLKLDRSLVVDAQQDDGSRAMMLSSISLARAMRMGVTAEGVETDDQADMVRAAGADQIQGWLYYRAMPAAQIEELRDKFGSQGSMGSKVA